MCCSLALTDARHDRASIFEFTAALKLSPVGFETLAATQSSDNEIQNLLDTDISLRLEQIPIPDSNHTLLCDTSQGRPRPLISQQMRHDIFNSLHALSHPGVKVFRHLICSRYVWPNIKRDIAHWTRACHDCQHPKIQRHVKAPLQNFEAPSSRFSHIHIDIVGPMPSSSGYTCLFTCIERYTRWPKAIRMTDATAESCASAMLSGWRARFGVPTTITSGQGQQLESRRCSRPTINSTL